MLGFFQRLLNPGQRNAQPASTTPSQTEIDPNAPFIVSMHEDRVVVHLPNGKREEVEWSKLEKIVVRNTNEGTWANDSWLILIGTKKSKQGCVVPRRADNFSALLERVQALPGFDLDTCQRVMAETSPDAVCWERGKATA
jgi:hypothetical protein